MTRSKYTYFLKAVNADGSPPVASSTLRWPLKRGGKVTCEDWDPTPKCGNGLHGWVGGAAHDDGGVMVDATSLKWLVFKAPTSEVVLLRGKAKARTAHVVYVATGTGPEARQRAVQWMDRSGVADPACSWVHRFAGHQGTATAGDYGTATATAGHQGTATAGDHGTATAGYHGTATAGYHGTATAGYHGTATAGNFGTATAGYYGTATAGHHGTATAWERGTATAGNYGTATAGDDGTATAGYRGTVRIQYTKGGRRRWAVGYIGEDGLLPNTPYKCDYDGNFIPTRG